MTKEVNDLIVNFSSQVNNKVENGKIGILRPIFKLYDLGMGSSL